MQFKGFPVVIVNGVAQIGGDASAGLILRDQNTWSQRASLTWVRGTHAFKFGANHRIQQLNDIQSNFLTPRFTFENQFTAINPLRLDNASGIGMASFLLGYGGGVVNKSDRLANQRTYIALFLQDD